MHSSVQRRGGMGDCCFVTSVGQTRQFVGTGRLHKCARVPSTKRWHVGQQRLGARTLQNSLQQNPNTDASGAGNIESTGEQQQQKQQQQQVRGGAKVDNRVPQVALVCVLVTAVACIWSGWTVVSLLVQRRAEIMMHVSDALHVEWSHAARGMTKGALHMVGRMVIFCAMFGICGVLRIKKAFVIAENIEMDMYF